jgi:4a-hydroxytetrahydrobiopterin dehydratase
MDRVPSRREVSDAVGPLGWRFLLGELRTFVRVGSLAQAGEVAAAAVTAAGSSFADEHLRIDLRRDRACLSLQTLAAAWVTGRDVALAGRISTAVVALGLRTDPAVGDDPPRSAQVLEIAIDALDILAVRPFWKAVMGYVDEPGSTDPTDPLADPFGQGPTIWFQQMDEPRPQRNRIHFDVSVPHDEAARRIESAVAAGGVLRNDAGAPAYWLLADPEGNEVCVTTWQGRDG